MYERCIKWSGFFGRTILLIGLIVAASTFAAAERLPVKIYTTADGLAQNSVNQIVRDSRGFLWFCTDEGFSRFDGYSFTNYTTADGLPHPVVNSFLETRNGLYWVGTYYGVCRFNPKGRPPPGAEPDNQRTTDAPMFALYPQTGMVNVLLEDRAGVIWAGAGRGLYRLDQINGEWTVRAVEIGLPQEVDNDIRVRALVEDRHGALWIGAGSGLYRRWPDGRTERYTTEHGLPANDLLALLIDTDGQLWVGTRKGLAQIALGPGTHQPRIIRLYTEKNGLPNPNTRSLFRSSTGQLWVGSSTALVEFVPQPGQDGSRFGYYDSELVLNKLFVQTLAKDRDGNLWIGTDNGAIKLARNGFTTYTEADGLGESRVSSIFESRAGDLCVMTLFSSATPLSWFEGKRFRAIRPRLPRRLTYFGWGWHQITLQDRAGEWWLPTGQGLIRYPKVDHVRQLAATPPKAIYTTRDGLASNDVTRLYEDSRGDIWIATFSEALGGISRWERATETIRHCGEADGLPLKNAGASAFGEDREGNLWIGFIGANFLARFSDGRFTLFTSEQGLPVGSVYDLYLDRAGRLWIATTGGLARMDDTSAERPQFITYTTAEGLSTNSINCITEDRYGRLYVGTSRGLDRLDPATGRVKPFTAADGLFSGEVLVSYRDRKGDLWFGGKGGLSRLSPQPDPPQSPPPVLITGLSIGGETHRISALGETEIALVELGPDRNQIQIEFVALGFSPGEGLRYQYKLEGASEEWSELAEQRTVNFARLAAGRYRFLVRAVDADGMMSDPAASFSFTILPPVWQRWWFIWLAVIIMGLAVYSVYRYRLAQKLKVERVRTRIATDLHDDIGANLSLIAMASEVAHRQSRQDDRQIEGTLSLISGTSRELVDSMGDIVWAVNPDRDHLVDLVKRMRRFASDVFSARGIAFRFEAPPDDRDIRLGTETRREMLLIFKEAVNNIARHSECTEAGIEFILKGGRLVLKLSDNGKGFDAEQTFDGNGLQSMRQRAERLGGSLEVASLNGKGTRVTLETPIR
ncbi:MAG TPA: two-component regulator propeller domain-containing protein [Blastocatellia bacterium]|nr:two-component regulator propeller domain-containing protein [Blastocatellia bacterium]